MKRTFIAIDIVASDKLKEAFSLIRYRLRLERITWVSEGNLHLTLNFLGDTEEQFLPDIAQRIELVLKEQKCFELTLRSLGIFKDLRDPRVLWVGCDSCRAIQQIKTDLDNCLSDLGFIVESRAFSPHLTIGRIKDIRQINQLSQLITMYKDVEFQKQLITHVVLYESKLSPTGPEYAALQRHPLL